jgi:DNA-directed RNA polymerase subunit K/omega
MQSEIVVGCPEPELVTHHTPALTKYERASAIGRRARMIGENAPVHVDVTGLDDHLLMAEKELYSAKCPLYVRRFHPNHTTDSPRFLEYKISEMRLSEWRGASRDVFCANRKG